MNKFFYTLCAMFCVLICAIDSYAQYPANYDESKVPEYQLPEALISNRGKKISTRVQWEKRRCEIIELLSREMYGFAPSADCVAMSAELLEESSDAFGSLATRRQIDLHLSNKNAPDRECILRLLIYTPNAAKDPVPAFLGINFFGNAATTDDLAVLELTDSQLDALLVDPKVKRPQRNEDSRRWPYEYILQKGYAVVTYFRGDVDPDFDDGFRNGIHGAFDDFSLTPVPSVPSASSDRSRASVPSVSSDRGAASDRSRASVSSASSVRSRVSSVRSRASVPSASSVCSGASVPSVSSVRGASSDRSRVSSVRSRASVPSASSDRGASSVCSGADEVSGGGESITIERPGDAWGTIAAWAWSLSRVMDFLETQDYIDASRIAVHGHSRLGKAALWAGATDERFALVISNNSGCGGAALSKRVFGENTGIINEKFPHWFCANYHKYGSHDELLPFDQHFALSLVAPRPLYVASADLDRWSDPHGEFLGLVEASKVYNKIYGFESLEGTAWPKLGNLWTDRLAYHIREGKHDILLYDWMNYIIFCDRFLK